VSEPTVPTAAHQDPDVPDGARSLGVLGFIVVAIVYLVIVQGLPYLTTAGLDDVDYGVFPDTDTVWLALVIPVGVSGIFAALVVTWLRWWPQVMRDHRPVQRWVWVIPTIMVLAILAGTDYSDLVDQAVGFVALFIFGALLVGFAEELMFRGIGVTTFRANAFPEKRVALWTSVIFGLAHATNLFTEGASALVQVLVTMLAGYFFYLVLRVSGSLAVAMVMHGAWDFGLFSGAVTDEAYIGAAAFLLADVAMAIILLVRRHSIEPTTGPTTV
jgi:CAAX protease family protein